MKQGRGFAHGTCGELLQGILPDRTEFQVTLPINRGTLVEVELEPAHETTVTGLMPKAVRAVELAVGVLGIGHHRVVARRHTSLPVGVGMGSSTADIVASARAIAAAVGRRMSSDELACVAGSIEPSDGTMYDGIVAVHRRGGRLREWAWQPQFLVAMVRSPGAVETDSVDFSAKATHADQYNDLLEMLEVGAGRRDPSIFAAVATQSAVLNEPYVANPLLRRALQTESLGVCVAHTGTMLGLLFPLGAASHALAAAHHVARAPESESSSPGRATVSLAMAGLVP